ncbi:MAG: hypothetical protein GF335_00540 [Candidatus Moranbacteria bacterium]|nr:hypothetical protein [Candidatus Moranbacteria bacterium]
MDNKNMENLINRGIIAINQKKHNTSLPLNILVMGLSRSGTSMTAIVLEELGVFMGKEKDNIVHEDLEIVDMLEKNNEIAKFKNLIQERNKKYGIWGWKRPHAYEYLSKTKDLLTNPHFIFMFRDPLAIAIRNKIATKVDPMVNLERTIREYQNFFKSITSTKYPTLLISYEKIISNKQYFVEYLNDYFNINCSPEQLKKAALSIQPNKKDYIYNARVK